MMRGCEKKVSQQSIRNSFEIETSEAVPIDNFQTTFNGLEQERTQALMLGPHYISPKILVFTSPSPALARNLKTDEAWSPENLNPLQI